MPSLRPLRSAPRHRPPIFGALATALLAIATGPTGAHAFSMADWTRFDLTPPASETSFPNDAPASIAADGTGRTTLVWGRVGVHAQVPSNVAVVARTRSSSGAWSPLRTVSSPDESITPIADSANDANSVTAANEAGDVATVWHSCTVDVNGSTDYQHCRLRWAVQARGTTTWSVPERVEAIDRIHGASTKPAIAINDEGDVTVAWIDHQANYQKSASVRTFRNEPSGYVAEATQPLAALPSDLTLNDMWQVGSLLLATRADGNAVATWALYEHRIGAFSGCAVTMTSTQQPNGTWRAPMRLDHGNCLTTSSFDHALARDGDDVLAVYSTYDVVTGSDFAAHARTLQADGTPGPTVAIGAGIHHWTHNTGWPTVNPLAVASNGRAAFVAEAQTADPDDVDRYTPAVWTRAHAGGTWSRSEPAPTDASERSFVGDRRPAVAIEDDGAVTAVWRRTDGEQRIQVVRRPAGGEWLGPLTVSDDEDQSAGAYGAVVASRGEGPPLVAWTQGHRLRTVVLGGVVNAAPVASFTWSPVRPIVGSTVSLTSTSTDSDGTIVRYEWDLNDDGDFGDAVGATAYAGFAEAGTHTVELRVTDDDGDEDTVSHEITVDPLPTTGSGGGEPSSGGGKAPAGGPAGGPTPAPGPGSPGGSSGGAPPVPPFIVVSTVDTTGRRTVPSVVGRSLDDAHGKLVRALKYVDIRSTRVISAASKLPKRPGGGRWRVGDVIAQTPDSGKKLTTSTSAQASAALRFWAGEKGDRSHCNGLRSTLKKDDLATATVVLKAAGCGSKPDLVLVPAKGVDEPTVKSIAKDGDITVAVPTDPAKLDLVTWRGTGILGSVELGPLAGDFSLTAGQANTIGIVLRDRAGRRVKGAKVKVDMHEVGGKDTSRQTDGSGAFATTVKPARPGTIHVLSEFADAKGEKIYGYAAFEVKRRTDKTLVTAVGNTFTRNARTGRYDLTKRATARAQGVAAPRAINLNAFFDAVTACLRGLGGSFARLPGSASEQVYRATSTMGISVFSLWRGKDAGKTPSAVSVRSTTTGVWRLQPNGVVAAGGANVIAAGGGNVVAAGGANVVAAGGANVVAAGGLNLLSDNGLGVIAAGGGNLVRLPDGSRVVAAGGGNVIAAGGGNVVAAGGGNVVAAGGLN